MRRLAGVDHPARRWTSRARRCAAGSARAADPSGPSMTAPTDEPRTHLTSVDRPTAERRQTVDAVPMQTRSAAIGSSTVSTTPASSRNVARRSVS